ncbi:MAG: DNA-3-methyladenine glycosylase, partial [Cyanobacteria bacterium P01_F01_bin.3]
DRDGFPSTILIRAVHLEKLPSWHIPKKKPDKLEKIAAGPGKLCRELKIDESMKGVAIHPKSRLWIEATPYKRKLEITQTTRIGLSKGTEIPWRWYLTHSPAVSRKRQ